MEQQVKKFLFILLLFCTTGAVAQRTTVLDPLLRPSSLSKEPEWFKVFDGDERDINVFELDRIVTDYANAYPLLNKNAPKDLRKKDNYMRFYSRWRREAERYIQPNGFLYFPSESEQKELAAFDKKLYAKRMAKAKQNAGNKHYFIAPSVANWYSIGPSDTYEPRYHAGAPLVKRNYGSNIYCIEMAPSNHNIVYAGGETGGLFKSTDKGLNWSATTETTVFGGSIAVIAIHPNNPDELFVVAGKKLFKSTDGGASFNLLNSNFNSRALIIHPTMPNIMYTANENGVYKSQNGGNAWSISLSRNNVTDIEFNTANQNTLYAFAKTTTGDAMSLYKTSNAGTNWTELSGVAGYPSITEYDGQAGGLIATTKADPNRVYVIYLSRVVSLSSPNNRVGRPVFIKTTDDCASFTYKMGTGSNLAGQSGVVFGLSNGQGFYDLVIEANDLNADEVIVGTTSIYKTSDGGNTFKAMGGYQNESGQPFQIHPDMQWLVCRDGDTFLSTDGGVVYSSDFFKTAANSPVLQKGITGTEFWGFDIGWNEDMAAGGTYHNGNLSVSLTEHDGKTLRLGGAESPTGHFFPGKRRHAAFDDIGGKILPERIDDIMSGGFSLGKYPSGDGYGYNASYLLIHPHYFNTIFVGRDSSLWKSIDGGNSFVELKKFERRIRKFAISRSNPDVFYVAIDKSGMGSLQKTTDGGQSWANVNLPTTNTTIGGSAIFIAIHPRDENKVWITDRNNNQPVARDTWGKLYYSSNGGQSWTNITPGDALNSRRILDIASDGANGIYIVSNPGPVLGTGAVVLYSEDGQTNFIDFSANYPRNASALRMLPYFAGGKLKIGGNRGAWETDLRNKFVPPVAQPIIEKNLIECLRDEVQLDSYSIVNADGVTWEWSVAPATATISDPTMRNPTIRFHAVGNYDITLKVTDKYGQTDTKTLPNAVVITEDKCAVSTLPGNAVKLTNNGQNSDYLVQEEALNIPATNTVTMSAWVKREGAQNDWAGLVFFRGGANTRATGLNVRSNGRLAFHWNDLPQSYNFNTNLVLPDNEWAHVALVANNTGVTIYLNGVASRMNYNNLPKQTFDTKMAVGREFSSASRVFKGQIDEVAFYNRALSVDEIRELMHLTKNNPNANQMPAVDNSLLHYYQFNEDVSSRTVLDKVGSNHLSLSGGAVLQPSTAPVGGGVNVHLQNVTSGGTKVFGNTGVELTFPSSGQYPNGKVVVTRLYNNPNQLPNVATVLPHASNPGYWVIRNFGTNQIFSPLTKIKFSNVAKVAESNIAPNAVIQLFKRGSNDDSEWQSVATTTERDVANKAIIFNNTNLNSFSQFILGSTEAYSTALSSFDVTMIDCKASLNWSLSSVENLSNFEIEKSVDGNQFNKIATVAITDKKSYSWEDKNTSHKATYRLKIINKNGTFIYSPAKTVLSPCAKDAVVVYPNPFGNVMYVKYAATKSGSATIQLLDAIGRVVLTQNNSLSVGDNILSINTSKLAPAQYFLVVKNNNETIVKMIVLKK